MNRSSGQGSACRKSTANRTIKRSDRERRRILVSDRSSPSPGTGRRLGLPTRPVHLAVPPPNRLLIPRPTVQPTRTQTASLQVPDRAVVIAEPAPKADTPHRLIKVGLVEEGSLRGSVSLLGRLGPPALPPPWNERDLAEPTGGPGPRPVPWQDDGNIPLSRRLSAVLEPPIDLLLARQGPLGWPQALRPYQIAGVRQLISREALLLADDMGLGKTIQAIAALRILSVRGKIKSALVVTPAGLLGQWRSGAATMSRRTAGFHGAWQRRQPGLAVASSRPCLSDLLRNLAIGQLDPSQLPRQPDVGSCRDRRGSEDQERWFGSKPRL